MLRPSLLALVAVLVLGVPAPVFATGGGSRCEPRTAADWSTACLSADGREEIRNLLRDVRQHALFADVDTVEEACLLLAPSPGGSDCSRARRQLFALALNRAAGRLGPGCCVEIDGHRRRLADLLSRDADDCRAGNRCAEIRELAAALNSGERVVPCEDGGGAGTPGDGDGCCRPRSKGFWHRQCLGIGELTPGRSENGKGPGVHPAFTEDELRAILARADRRIGGRCRGACDALDEQNYRTARGRAEAQYAAFILNAEAGYLRGCGESGDLIRRVERLMDAGQWDEAARLADEANNGRSLRRCGDDRGEDAEAGEHHDGDDDGDDDHGHDHDKDSKDKDKGGKSKGKGKG